MVEELYALDTTISNGIAQVDAYLVLPDSTHAHGVCTDILGETLCTPEPVNAEKRAPNACTGTHCVYHEKYPADRKGNDITLHAANGKVAFHIQDFW
jgi:hypothetical protein